uniref:ULP_PROTEASE domain-containing protein n=1 Tax=Steinernema glaseri TaxID=37863 RepID=A0A1I7Z0U4_9BILA
MMKWYMIVDTANRHVVALYLDLDVTDAFNSPSQTEGLLLHNKLRFIAVLYLKNASSKHMNENHGCAYRMTLEAPQLLSSPKKTSKCDIIDEGMMTNVKTMN